MAVSKRPSAQTTELLRNHVNSYILHKITDPVVVSTLRRTVSGIDEGLWNRISGLAPGQAIVLFPHMERPLLVSIDPAPCELRLVE